LLLGGCCSVVAARWLLLGGCCSVVAARWLIHLSGMRTVIIGCADDLLVQL
jgi:hypothetical protein